MSMWSALGLGQNEYEKQRGKLFTDSLKVERDFARQTVTGSFTITDAALEKDPLLCARVQQQMAMQQQATAQWRQLYGGVSAMSGGGGFSGAGGLAGVGSLPNPPGVGTFGPPPPAAEPGTRTNVKKAIEQDLEAQGPFNRADTHDIDAGRLARAAVRALRNLDDSVFEAAGINPERHKDNFKKVIDTIMKGL